MNEQYWKDRGAQDALKGKSPIFRETRRYGIVPEGETGMGRDEEIEAGRSYLEGYNTIESRGHVGVASHWS